MKIKIKILEKQKLKKNLCNSSDAIRYFELFRIMFFVGEVIAYSQSTGFAIRSIQITSRGEKH